VETLLSAAEPIAIRVEDSSHAAAARMAVQGMAHGLGFNDARASDAAIVVTEAVSNIVKHAGRGIFVARSLARAGTLGIEMLAIDSGPGMASLPASSRDGHSTAGTPGTGLGAMGRIASEMEVFTRPGDGTIVRMVVWERRGVPPPAEDYQVGAVALPKAGETACGDAWGMETHPRGATLLVADGLGHGPDACVAAQAAVDALRRYPDERPSRVLDVAHGMLRATRGAAVAVMRHDLLAGTVAYAGIGNIAAVVLNGPDRKAMVSHNGILGHGAHRAHEFEYAWPGGALMVAHTDGLQSQWSLAEHSGIFGHHPSIIAALLVRDYSRGRDDVTVLAVRAPGSREER
jgi:anti-sigma regulatory factor (Ser/Thr protein kinase)